jgi:hypothetical protein
MENNITISILEYNDLRDFRTKIQCCGNILVQRPNGGDLLLYTKDEVITALAKYNAELASKLATALVKENDLNNIPPMTPTRKQFEQMSIWQFIKWRKCYTL